MPPSEKKYGSIERSSPRFSPGEAWALGAVLALAALLRTWHLERNGFANTYYAAAVRSMVQSWHNFFFVSFDPAGWVTVDKPPLALWIQAASAKAFGFGPWSLLLPQAAEGVCGVALLYALVRRTFDRQAALLAGLLLALTPISVAVDRYNNVDACLVLVLLAAAYALSRALDQGRRGWLLAAAALMGLGFNTKMLAAFTVLPAVGLLLLLAWPGALARRMKDFALAAAVLAFVSLAWVACVDLTPAAQRPYVGSTQDNSMLGLTLGWNGLQRFTGRRPNAQKPETAAPEAETLRVHAAHRQGKHGGRRRLKEGRPGSNTDAGTAPRATPYGPARGPGAGRGGMGAGQPGPTRLAQPVMAGQVLWFLPLALLGLVSAARRADRPFRATNPDARGREKAPALWRRAMEIPGGWRASLLHRPQAQALFLWAGWLCLCAVVLSALRTMHTYYLVLLAPPMAALGGIGLRALWLEYRQSRRDLLPVALFLTALWQGSTLLQTPDWNAALLPLLAGAVAVAALILGSARRQESSATQPSWARIGLATGLLALFACPLGWALTPVLSATGDHAVEADPSLLTGAADSGGRPGAWGMRGGGRQNQPEGYDHRLLAFLEAHRGRARYLVAAANSQAVAPLIIASGEPAISVGGFMGGDPIITADAFARLVAEGQIRYFLMNSARPGPGDGPGGAGDPAQYFQGAGPWGGRGQQSPQVQQLQAWLRNHGRPVDPALWRSPSAQSPYRRPNNPGGFLGGRGGALQLIDLSLSPI